MSDAPNHRLFALLPPLDNQEKAIKNIICYVQVAIEGKIGAVECDDATNRGKRPDGNLTPWTLRRQFLPVHFVHKIRARRVNIVKTTRPRYISQLGQFIQHALYVFKG